MHFRFNFQINSQQQNITPLVVLCPATTLEVRTIIMNGPSKSCELDPMPTWLLKKCIDEILLIPSIAVDIGDLKIFRPVYNLQFASKVIKK